MGNPALCRAVVQGSVLHNPYWSTYCTPVCSTANARPCAALPMHGSPGFIPGLLLLLVHPSGDGPALAKVCVVIAKVSLWTASCAETGGETEASCCLVLCCNQSSFTGSNWPQLPPQGGRTASHSVSTTFNSCKWKCIYSNRSKPVLHQSNIRLVCSPATLCKKHPSETGQANGSMV